MSVKTEWDLKRYFYESLDDPKFLQDLSELLPKVQKFAQKWSEKLKRINTPEELATFIEEEQALSESISKPAYYVSYLESLDTQNSRVLKIQGEIDVMFIEAGNLLLFISQAWKEIGYDRLLEWSKSPALAGHTNAVIHTAESIKRILGEKEEYVLNIKSRPLGTA